MNSRTLKKIKIDQALSHISEERYRRLIDTVLWKIPRSAWDSLTPTVDFSLCEYSPAGLRGYGNTAPAEILDAPESQLWLITLYRPMLDALTDRDVLFVMAHELGHVATSAPVDEQTYFQRRFQDAITRKRETARDEHAADAFAARWGFAPDPAGPLFE